MWQVRIPGEGSIDGTSVDLAHSGSLFADFGHQVHAGHDSEVVSPRRENSKRLQLSADGQRPDALLQRGQDGLRND